MEDYMHYWAHRKLAWERFHHINILNMHVFDLVDWEMEYQKLQDVPKMSQLWACKQVMGITGTMEWDKAIVKKCPSCMQEQDTCKHVLFCCHAGQVETLQHTVDLMENWLMKADTEPDLLDCITEYAYSCGGRLMTEICNGLGEEYQEMARDQDAIGWTRFMEGMICKRRREIQRMYHIHERTRISPEPWAQGLILKLLEATHGQWIYRNIQIHNTIVGTHATLRKESIQREIEEQMEQGKTGLLEEDHWMMKVNLGDMDNT